MMYVGASKRRVKPQKRIKSNKSTAKLKRKAKIYNHVLIKLLHICMPQPHEKARQ